MKGLLLVLVAGCGTDTISVPVTVPGRPALFSGTTNGGAWRTFAGTPDAKTTTYMVDIDGDFALAMVCIHSNRAFVASEVFGTYDDANITIGSWEVPDCTEPATEDAPLIDVTGTLDTQGNVAIDDRVRYVIGGEPFDLSVAAGIHDILVHSNYTVLIEHDRELTKSTDVGILPIGAAGTPMIQKEFVLATYPETTLDVITSVKTRNGTTFEWPNQTIDQAVFVPPDQLGAEDVQTFQVFASDLSGTRRATITNFDQVPADFTLLPTLAPIGILPDGIAVQWTPIGDFFTTAQFTATPMVTQNTTYASEMRVSASKLWLDRHQTSILRFDRADVPGYRDEWTFAPSSWNFSVEQWSPGQIIESLTQNTYPFGR